MGGGIAIFDYDNDGRMDLFFTNGAALKDAMSKDELPIRRSRSTGIACINKRLTELSEMLRNAPVLKVLVTAWASRRRITTTMALSISLSLATNRIVCITTMVTELLAMSPVSFRKINEAGPRVPAGSTTIAMAASIYSSCATWIGTLKAARCFAVVQPPCYAHTAIRTTSKARQTFSFINAADGSFEDVSKSSGIADPSGKGLGVAFADFDNDGWTDVFVANDSVRQSLYRNKGDGTFEDIAVISGAAYDEDGRTFAGMGIDCADYDNDGYMDVFITTLSNEKYALYRNNGDLSFTYATNTTGVGQITLLYSGWGTRFVDVDNDGLRDLFVAQSHVLDTMEKTTAYLKYKQPLLLMRNTGKGFVNVSATAGAAFNSPVAARGAAFGDLNNDGQLDAVDQCARRCAGDFAERRNEKSLARDIAFWNQIESKWNRCTRDCDECRSGRSRSSMRALAGVICRRMIHAS